MTRPMCQLARASRICPVCQNPSGTTGGADWSWARSHGPHRRPLLSAASGWPQRLQLRRWRGGVIPGRLPGSMRGRRSRAVTPTGCASFTAARRHRRRPGSRSRRQAGPPRRPTATGPPPATPTRPSPWSPPGCCSVLTTATSCARRTAADRPCSRSSVSSAPARTTSPDRPNTLDVRRPLPAPRRVALATGSKAPTTLPPRTPATQAVVRR